MVGTILVTAGTGKTGSFLEQKLRAAGYSTLITTRNPTKLAPPLRGVQFNWLEPSTYENPFKADSNIDRMYLVCPEITNEIQYVKPFIDLAVRKGVKRIVVLSATVFEKGKPGVGRVHAYLEGLGIDYHVLRPSWFFENFTTMFLDDIKRNEILSLTGQGKCGLISVDDITRIAMESLIVDKAPNTDTIIIGPEILSYDEVAAILSEVVGRQITHKQSTKAYLCEFWVKYGIPEEFAMELVALDGFIRDGTEASRIHAPNKVIGKLYFRDFVVQNKEVFGPA